MNSLNTDNHSKTSAFKNVKHLLYKIYLKFVKVYKKQPNRLDIRKFLVLLYDCVPNMKDVWSINKPLKNANVLQIGTGQNPTTPLYSETTKLQNVL